jgi:DNA-binding beta-propeller fold protein YncE
MKKILLLFLLTASFVFAVEAQSKAPELTGAKNWLNTEKPLTLSELRGKVVLLDFWTYGCINCIHIIPDLKKLEAKYAKELVVIGVHSGKFTNERDTGNIRKIIARYDLEHPVANDADFKIWDAYGVQAYPTQVLINPNGEIVIKTVGEGQLNLLDKTISETIAEFRKNGKLDEKPRRFRSEKETSGESGLLFPGKVLADAARNRLFIADSNHNRILITKLNGELVSVVGSGKASLTDGDFSSAAFNRPQGMTTDGKFLYVADTNNHAVRRVDINGKTVETIAGTGEQKFNYDGGEAKKTPLNSPWDVLLLNGRLFVAMAGQHQIWQMDLEKQTIAPFAGSGREARFDGDLDTSAFAQPSGLATDGKFLYVADAESNVIRQINLTSETVKTLAGGDLYDFGDKDGAGEAVRLQHPLGIAVFGKEILIADTYNHKIKTLNPTDGTVKTLLGGAKTVFYEPGGLSVAGNQLFVADTNNHRIQVVDLRSKQISTLKINNLKAIGNLSVIAR